MSSWYSRFATYVSPDKAITAASENFPFGSALNSLRANLAKTSFALPEKARSRFS